jgi:hypothetical protein
MQAVHVNAGLPATETSMNPLAEAASSGSCEELDAAPSQRRPRNSISGGPSKRGWCLKKGKTDRPWGKAHHSHRYFVSRGHALCYFERAGDESSELGGQRLLGLIDLREVLRVRRSADATAPEHAIDLVMRSRTYVLVPQPASAEEVIAWVRVWSHSMRANVVAPELRAEAGLEVTSCRASTCGCASISRLSMRGAACGESSGSQESMAPLPEGSTAALPEGSAELADGAAAALGGAWLSPDVLLQGSLLKMPVAREARWSLPNVLGELTSWRRRYFQLRRGMIQWYKEDPAVGGEFLGVLRLTPDTCVVFDPRDSRLTISVGREKLTLKEEGGDQLAEWEAEVSEQVRALQLEAAADASSLDTRLTAETPNPAV